MPVSDLKAKQCRNCPATENLWRGQCNKCKAAYQQALRRKQRGRVASDLPLIRPLMNHEYERRELAVEPVYRTIGAIRVTICPPSLDAEWAERTAGRLAAVRNATI